MTEFIPALTVDATILQNLWFLLIGVLTLGYFVLDGFDLGVGALYPFIAKSDQEKALLRRSVGPVWDGNEVWLLTAGGALFAAFAPAYATTFSGFYLAIMLVLFGLIARAAGLEFRSHDTKWFGLWDGAFFIGSALPALLFGVAIGNVIEGLPLNALGDYVGLPLIGLLRPFPLACGLLGLATMLLQGAAWTALKMPLDSALRSRAIGLRKVFLVAVLVLFVLATALFFLLANHSASINPLNYVFVVLVIVGVVASFLFHNKGNDLLGFVSLNLVPVGLVGITAASLFPLIVPSLGPGPSLSIATAGSSELSLTVMTIVACIGVPLVLIYHVITYRMFRGRLSSEDVQDY